MITALVAATVLTAVSVESKQEAVSNTPTVELLLTGRKSKDHPLDKGYVLHLAENGKLRDTYGKRIADDALGNLLKTDSEGDDETKHLVHVVIANEKDTSIATLSDAIERIKKAADPRKKTLVIVHLKGIPSD